MLAPFLASRLIPLDKNPGLGSNGTGELLRRKDVIIRKDLISSVGPFQFCTGDESIIHAMHRIYEEDESEAIVLSLMDSTQ